MSTEDKLRRWQPIETRPPGDAPCWIGHSLSGTMIVARPGKHIDGVWYIMWSDRMLPWTPDLWQPLPSPPAVTSSKSHAQTENQ